jgi:hypothetical protein
MRDLGLLFGGQLVAAGFLVTFYRVATLLDQRLQRFDDLVIR